LRDSCIPRTILVLACVFGTTLFAQDTTELMNRMKAMEDRIKALEAELQAMKGEQAALTAAMTAAQPQAQAAAQPPGAQVPGIPSPTSQAQASEPTAGPNLGGLGGAAAKALNPDISVIGDFQGAAGYGAHHGTPALEMHESEVGFQEVIDPYARADFFISFGEHGVDLEEGYITFTSLPKGLLLKAGKMRAAFGVVNTLHNHVLPWTDRPLVTQNIVGGEDGIDDAGLSLSRFLPAPKGIFLEGTAQLFRGDSDGIFVARRRNDVSTVEHLRAYRDLSEATNLTLGASYSRGHSFWGNGTNQLFGVDATFRWKPLRRAIYNSFIGRSEFIWSRTAVSPDPESGSTRTEKPFGYYISGDYQLNRRWFVGARFDRSDRITTEAPYFNINSANPLLKDTGGSLIVTYWPSEFAQIRGQLRRTHYGENLTANELLFQFQFSMGAHGAHPF
jgi:hypothetical protein